jgi:hypothetical protein
MLTNDLHLERSLAETCAMEELRPDLLAEISGAAPCSYLGVHDYNLMMSYETRNYCC